MKKLTEAKVPELINKKIYWESFDDFGNKIETGEARIKEFKKEEPYPLLTDCYKGRSLDAVKFVDKGSDRKLGIPYNQRTIMFREIDELKSDGKNQI